MISDWFMRLRTYRQVDGGLAKRGRLAADAGTSTRFIDSPAIRLLRDHPSVAAFAAFFGGLTVWFVAGGVHAVSDAPFWAASAFALALMGVQLVLWRERRGNGLRLGVLATALYALLVLGNVTLAAGGIVAEWPDRLGRTQFHQQVNPAVAQIQATANSFAMIASTTKAVATYSADEIKAELNPGGTCRLPARLNEGPDTRLRRADAASFAQMSATADELARDSAGAAKAVRDTVSNYTAAQHGQAVAAIETALARATAAASDTRLAGIRAALKRRQDQITAGRPDEKTGKLVVCPDATLSANIAAALAAPLPVAPRVGELPAKPSPATSTMGLAQGLANWAARRDYVLAPWAAALIAAPLIDALFFYALMLLESKSRAAAPPRSPGREAAGHLGIAGGWGELLRAAGRVSDDPAFSAIKGFHSVLDTGFSRSDFLCVPVSDAAHCLWARALCPALGSDAGIRARGDAPEGMRPRPDADTEFQFVVLKPGVWRLIEGDALRSAAAVVPDAPASAETPVEEAAA